MGKLKRTIRDFVLLPVLVIICLAIVVAWGYLIDSILSSNFLTGEIQIDVFSLLLTTVPFILLIRFIWSKVESINIDQFIEQGYEEELNKVFSRKITLYTGSTGSGKTHYLDTIVTAVGTCYSPKQIMILCIDPKKTGVDPSKINRQYLYNEVIWKVDEAVEKLKKTVEEFNNKNEAKLIILIDEISDIMNSHNLDFESILSEISKTKNIYLVMTTSRPSKQVLTSNFLSYVGERVDLPERPYY
jgi:Cdc6-like AAA superfamily ATPase